MSPECAREFPNFFTSSLTASSPRRFELSPSFVDYVLICTKNVEKAELIWIRAYSSPQRAQKNHDQ